MEPGRDRMCVRRFTTGFSLVEILVVVAIIMILAGLLLPVLMSTIARSKATSCGSNLRQLALATKMYADDHEGLLPPYANAISFLRAHDPDFPFAHPESSVQPRLLVGALESYVRDKNVWYCPVDPEARKVVIRWNICHELTSYVFAYHTPGDVKWQWPVQVRLDAPEMQGQVMIADAADLPSSLMSQEQLTNHLDGFVNYVYSDASLHRSPVRSLLGLPDSGR